MLQLKEQLGAEICRLRLYAEVTDKDNRQLSAAEE
jgi:hypothetical protein